jgi:hypothetical protein
MRVEPRRPVSEGTVHVFKKVLWMLALVWFISAAAALTDTVQMAPLEPSALPFVGMVALGCLCLASILISGRRRAAVPVR